MDKSLWISNTQAKEYENLKENVNTQICIIGGGLTGLSTAYYLANNNKKDIVVLERNRIGEGTTGYSTGKITSNHGLFYKYLIDSIGVNLAKQYLESNEQAIKNIEKIVRDENIECEYEIKDNYVFTQDKKQINKIKEEVKAVNKLGKDAQYVNKEDINKQITNCGKLDENNSSKPILGAIKFKEQAQFNPYKYILGLAQSLEKKGIKIYENTEAIKIEKDNDSYIVKTQTANIYAKYIVIASHYPIVNFPGFYFIKMYQNISYMIGVQTDEEILDQMYINSENPTISIRTAYDNDNKKIVLIGGQGHKTGKSDIINDSYKELEKIAEKLFKNYKIKYKWSSEDCISLDKIPYIGEYSKFMPNVYVATGYKKWGITTSNVAANIISDKILGKNNKYEDVYNSKRLKPIKNRTELTNMAKETTNSLIIKKMKHTHFDIQNMKKEEGKIVEINNDKVGIYIDKNDEIYAIKPVCTHLGCELTWNNIDKTWDCPCHGSRYNYKGENIYNPALSDLKRINIKKENT